MASAELNSVEKHAMMLRRRWIAGIYPRSTNGYIKDGSAISE